MIRREVMPDSGAQFRLKTSLEALPPLSLLAVPRVFVSLEHAGGNQVLGDVDVGIAGEGNWLIRVGINVRSKENVIGFELSSSKPRRPRGGRFKKQATVLPRLIRA